MPTLSRHVELALYADDTVVIATSRQLHGFLPQRCRWLRERRIAIDVSKSTEMLFTHRRILRPLPVQLFGEPILWLDAACYLGVTWSSHIDRFRKSAVQRLGALGPLLYRSIGLAISNGFLLYKQHIRPMVDYGCPI